MYLGDWYSSFQNFIQTNNQPVILSGENCVTVFVVELPRVERKRTSGSARRSRSGIWLGISVAYQRNVTFSVASHLNSLPYPFVAFAPRFCSVLHSAKLRLRAAPVPPFAQNDIQRFYLIVFVRSDRKVNRPYKKPMDFPT